MRQYVLTGLLLAGLSSCVRVKSTPLGPSYAPLPADAEVRVFSTRTPECSYEEIALVIAYSAQTGDALAAVKRRTRKLGGDAIVGLTQFPEGDETSGGVKGTAVHFRDPACHH